MPKRVRQKYAYKFGIGEMRSNLFSEGETPILTVQAMLSLFPRIIATIFFRLDLQTLSYKLARPPLETEIPHYTRSLTSTRHFQIIWQKEGDYWLIILSKYSEIYFEPVEFARYFIWSTIYDMINYPFSVVTTSRLWIMSLTCHHHSLGNFERLFYSNVGEHRLHTVDCPLPPALGDLETWATGVTQV